MQQEFHCTTWLQGTAIGLVAGFGIGVTQQEAIGLTLKVSAQADDRKPVKPTYLVPEDHTHQEPEEEGGTTISVLNASGAVSNVSAQAVTHGRWIYKLGPVTTVPPNLPPLPPLTIEHAASTNAKDAEVTISIRPRSSDASP